MPVYECNTPQGALDADQRERLATGITKIHSEETQAPEPFIRVVFAETPEGYSYTAGKVAPSLIIRAAIRAGRPDEVRQAIMHRLFDLAREVSGMPPAQIVLSVVNFPAQWAMEAGFVLPDPTPEAEAAWFKDLEEAGIDLEEAGVTA